MPANYEIRIAKCTKEAWARFLEAPEVYILLTLAEFALSFVLPRIPNVGFLLWLVLTALALPAFVVVAEASVRRGRGQFADLQALLPLSPQLLAVAVFKLIAIGLASMLFLLPGLYLFVIYVFAEMAATIEKKPFWAALEESRALVRGHWFPVCGLAFYVGLVVFAGFLLLGVGVLVSFPVGCLILHAAYRDVRRQLAGTPEILDAEIVR